MARRPTRPEQQEDTATEQVVRVAVVAPRPMERGALGAAVEALAGYRVVVSAERVEDLLVACKRGAVVDVALVYLTNEEDVTALGLLRAAYPAMRLAGLGEAVGIPLTALAYCAGALAMLDLNEAQEAEVRAAVKDVEAGHLHVNGVMDRMLRGRDRSSAPVKKKDVTLTPTEQLILYWMAHRSGLTEQGIAEKMHRELSTVHTHVKHIYEKLGVHGHRQALHAAERHGLLDL